MSFSGNSLPKQWKGKTNTLYAKWEQRKQSQSHLEESGYDGITPSNTMTSLGNSLPKEWEGKTNTLPVQWEEVQRKLSKSQLKERGYQESLFMFEDGIVPFPSQLAKNDSNESISDDEMKKELMQRVNAYTNYVQHAPRDSKRLSVFKDIVPN